MHDADGVRRRERVGELAHDRQRVGLAERTLLLQPAHERAPVEQLHGQEEDRLALALAVEKVHAEVEDPADVRVADPAREQDLALEALASPSLAAISGRIVFKATDSPSVRSRAAYNSPMPPRAMKRSTRKRSQSTSPAWKVEARSTMAVSSGFARPSSSEGGCMKGVGPRYRATGAAERFDQEAALAPGFHAAVERGRRIGGILL